MIASCSNMTIRFLREDSIDLLKKLLPEIERTILQRIVNYLSFYSSHTGQHLYYSPTLRPSKHLAPLFAGKEPADSQSQSLTHIAAKTLLGAFFHNHIMDQAGAMRLFGDLRYLHSVGKDVRPQLVRTSLVSI